MLRQHGYGTSTSSSRAGAAAIAPALLRSRAVDRASACSACGRAAARGLLARARRADRTGRVELAASRSDRALPRSRARATAASPRTHRSTRDRLRPPRVAVGLDRARRMRASMAGSARVAGSIAVAMSTSSGTSRDSTVRPDASSNVDAPDQAHAAAERAPQPAAPRPRRSMPPSPSSRCSARSIAVAQPALARVPGARASAVASARRSTGVSRHRSLRDHEPRDRAARRRERIRARRCRPARAATRARSRASSRVFAGAAGDQVERVDGAPLADAIDAADALLEPHRIPRQLEVDRRGGSGGAG